MRGVTPPLIGSMSWCHQGPSEPPQRSAVVRRLGDVGLNCASRCHRCHQGGDAGDECGRGGEWQGFASTSVAPAKVVAAV